MHFPYLIFAFVVGSCVGSFLNVVIWRLPRGESLNYPGSHCPRCNELLRWYDNVPVFGWIKLSGKCRFCKEPISPRYPIVEAIVGLLFVFYYVMFFMAQIGPCAARPILVDSFDIMGEIVKVPRNLSIVNDWPIYALYMALVAGLLAGSLIDAETFTIPVQIPWVLAVVGIVVHAIIDKRSLPGALNLDPSPAALAAGGGVGLLISIALFAVGIIPISFPDGEPMQDLEPEAGEEEKEPAEPETSSRREFILLVVGIVMASAWLFASQRAAVAAGWTIAMLIALGLWAVGKYPAHSPETIQPPPHDPNEPAPPDVNRPWSRRELMREMRKEMAFLLPPMLLAAAWWFATQKIPGLKSWWDAILIHNWLSGLLGAVLGALIGGFVVWITRIVGTAGFGRLAMGLGDIHLMFGVGAIIGAGAATVAFFLAPFFSTKISTYSAISAAKVTFVQILILSHRFCIRSRSSHGS
jgi:prepilin signal peptidase PulO-like enzyme (type II secretory pathway)